MDTPFSLPILCLLTENVAVGSFFKITFADKLHILVFKEPEEAFKCLRDSLVDICIVDSSLSESFAIDFCKKVFLQNVFADRPILLISNKIKRDFILEAAHAGVVGFINIPLTESDVNNKISAALKTMGLREKSSSLMRKIKGPKKQI